MTSFWRLVTVGESAVSFCTSLDFGSDSLSHSHSLIRAICLCLGPRRSSEFVLEKVILFDGFFTRLTLNTTFLSQVDISGLPPFCAWSSFRSTPNFAFVSLLLSINMPQVLTAFPGTITLCKIVLTILSLVWSIFPFRRHPFELCD
jgi:hypothetical protein